MKTEKEVRKMLDIVNKNPAVHPVVALVFEWVIGIRSHEDSQLVLEFINQINVEREKNSQPN
jgi:hypothetical protein